MTAKIPIDWENLIFRGVESEELDYKAAQNWRELGKIGKAKFARHCLALANTKGGYIVVGVGEDKSGRPNLYTGLTEEQAKSFDPTLVGNFINKYADPEIDFTIERPMVNGKRYAVFVIRPFNNLPHVCGYGCDRELQQGVFYIRTADASSRPAYRASEIHALIQRSLRKQRELLGRMIRGVLYEEKHAAGQEEARNLFLEQCQHSSELFFKKKNAAQGILLEITVFPSQFVIDKFTLSELQRAFKAAHYLYSGSSFISKSEIDDSYFTNVSLRAMPEDKSKLWQVFKTGLFHYIKTLDTAQSTLDYNYILKFIAEAVHCFSLFYPELGYDHEMLEIQIKLDRVEGIALTGVPGSSRKNKTKYICRIPEIRLSMRRTVVDLSSGMVDHAARIIREICERFNLPDGKHPDLRTTLQQFLEKRNL